MKTIEECRASHGRVWACTVDGVGEFVFRKPTSREWTEFDASRVPMASTISASTITKAIALEYLQSCEELCVRVVVSHTPSELEKLEEEHLGVYRDLAGEITSTIDTLRSTIKKESAPHGQPPSAAKSPSE